mgnify:CR=1 FL=1
MSALFPNPGEIFEGTYRIETILGSGGFARVYRAVEVALDRPVALKILRPPLNTSQSDSQRDNYLETLMERFQREAMMLSRLRSPYTVNLYKYGKTPDGLLYMALEYIDGLSLAEIMRAGKALSAARTVKIVTQVLGSLQEAHTLGMLHRDLKPANIMVYDHLGEKDKVKLLDFGIAKLVRDAPTGQQDLTSDGTLIGTPRYMAPEQIQGETIGPPADIYALGLVAFEMLTGQRAIKGDSSIQIIGKQLAPRSFRLPPDLSVPPRVRETIDRMITKKVSDRFQSAADVIAAFSAPSILLEEESDATEVDIRALVNALEADAHVEVAQNEADLALGPDAEDAEGDAPAATLTRLPLLIAGVLFMVLIAGSTFALLVQGVDDEAPPVTEPVAVKPTPAPPVAPEAPVEVQEAEVTISASLGGEELEGATVLISGVEKGFTPMRIAADAVRNSEVIVRYHPSGADEPLEEAQEVTTPRDVIVEFSPVVVVRPALAPERAPKEAPAAPAPPPARKESKRAKPRPAKTVTPRRSIYETLVPE